MNLKSKSGRALKTLLSYHADKAETDLNRGLGDLVAFGKPFINNPDLVERLKHNLPLSTELDFSTFYSPGEKAYADYPVYSV